MKIVVTGGAGMIGSNLVSELLKQDHDITVIDNLWRGKIENLESMCGDRFSKIKFVVADLSCFGDWVELFNGADVVYHLADIVAGIGYVFSNEGYIFRKNLIINANVAQACEIMKPKRYIYVGTACSFPQEIQYGQSAPPMVETQQLPAHPESAYGWSKLMGELDANYLNRYSGIDCVTLVFHNVFGTPSEYKGERTQAIPAMCYRALTEATESGELVVWGEGKQCRSFIPVSEVARSLILALEFGENAGPIQIGTDICSSVNDIAEKIIKIVEPSIKIRNDITRPSGDRGRCANTQKAKKLLGWESRFDLDEELEKLILWIKHQESI